MTLRVLGEVSVGELLPVGVAAAAQIDASLAVAIPQVTADLELAADVTASLEAQVAVPTDPTQALTAALALFTSGQLAASLTAGIGELGASLSADLSLNLAKLSALRAALAALEQGLRFSADLKAGLAMPGIEAFAYEGAVDALAGELGEALGGDAQGAQALVLVVRSPAAWAALSALVRTG